MSALSTLSASEPKAQLASLNSFRNKLENAGNAQESSKLEIEATPFLTQLLRDGKPSFSSQDLEHQVRLAAIETLQRFSFTEAFKPHTSELINTILTLLRVDNEEVACVCLKIFIDLHKAYKTSIEEFVQPFLDIVLQLYKNMPETVRETFGSPSVVNPPPTARTTRALAAQSPPTSNSPLTASETPDGTVSINKPLSKSLASFKVLTECPIIIVLLFSSYRQSVQPNLTAFTPVIIEMLSLQAPPAVKEAARGPSAAAILRKQVFSEFMLAQIKTLSFLAYVLRGFTAYMKKYATAIPQFVLHLLHECSPEMSAARKELLVATRHILSTEFRNAFLDKIEILLDEDVLVGKGVTAKEALRPLAYSMLADLIHHVRADLNYAQIHKTIAVYSSNLIDPTLSFSIQTMSAKLLLNMIDKIMKLPNQAESRHVLMLILKCFTERISLLTAMHGDDETQRPFDVNKLLKEQGIHMSMSVVEVELDHIKESRSLFKNLIIGLKTVLFGLKSCNPPAASPSINPQQWSEAVRGLTSTDIQVFIELFEEGAQGFQLYRASTTEDGTRSAERLSLENPMTQMLPSTREEKDILETFATVFIHLDPAAFQEIFDASLQTLFTKILDNAVLLHIPQFFLTNDTTSPNFAGLLLQFLVGHLDELGSSDPVRSSVLLRLFKMCFMAVTMFPDLNEAVLQPHLASIVIHSMKLSANSEHPLAYYILMRNLFRSIGGGRFELLYKEVLPLLQVLLESLNTLLYSARKQQEKELFVELCLTVPVRLSVLLPYLSYLMKPLVIALTAGPDLVTQGLRTLELCIDNLTQEFLDPILAPVLPDLMQALWSHLKPLPHNHHHSHSASRILGKMGGRNRRFIGEFRNFDVQSTARDQAFIQITCHGTEGSQPFPWMKFVPYAVSVLSDSKMPVVYKEKAFQVVSGSARLFFAAEASSFAATGNIRELARELVADASGSDTSSSNKPAIPNHLNTTSQKRLISRLEIQENAFKRTLLGLFYAASVPSLRHDCTDLVMGITRHFVLLHIIQAHKIMKAKKESFFVEAEDEDLSLSSDLLLNVLVEVLESDAIEVRQLAQDCIICMYDSSVAIMGDDSDVASLGVYDNLITLLCHACYQEAWYRKAAGVLGISILVDQLKLSATWYQSHQVDMVRALLYVVKDIMVEIPTSCNADATRLLDKIVINSRGTTDDSNNITSALVPVLISELANPNGKVRETTQELFQSMARLSGVPVQELLKPAQDRLLSPIFTKPLRALPFAMQIGHIDAITFCLSLSPSFLEFNDELLRLLHETLALADAEDDALVSVNRTSQYKSSSALVNLRIVCIKLLTIAVSTPDFSTPQQAQSRSRIIAVFFKSLYSKSGEVVEVANLGLKQVLSQNQKLPKDLLQAGLRPILMNLSDHKRLTVPGLEGLARLLELLTNYFKVEIGKKLLDHLRAWAEPATLQQISGKPLREQQSIKIIAAILNIFHLLPPTAHMFMEELVVAVSGLENKLRRTISSPLRPPLLRFINRYPSECWEYFITRMDDEKISTFLLQLADHPSSDPLREVMVANLPSLVSKPENVTVADLTKAQLKIQMLHIASRHGSASLLNLEILENLTSIYRNIHETCKSSGQDNPSPRLDISGAWLVDLYISFIKEHPSEVEVLLKLLMLQSEGIITATRAISSFINRHIIVDGELESKIALISAAIRKFPDAEAGQAFKTTLFQAIINPLLLSDQVTSVLHRGLIDRDLVDLVHSNIWKVALSDFGEDVICTSDILRVELLQMSTILLRYHTSVVSEVRKDVIKFAWNYIKLEDIATKNAAYVFICYFVAAYDTPAKMAAQIYFALLRTTQTEARILVKQALDALAPVLTKRVPAGSDARSPSWAKYTRKVMAEEHNTLPLIPVFQFITRHADLFSVCKEQFVPQMLAALPKLAFPQNVNIESKTVALHVLETLLSWAQDEENAMDTSDDTDSGRIQDSAHVEQLTRFLSRFVCMPLESPRKDFTTRILAVLKGLLQVKHSVELPLLLTFFEPFLADFDDKSQIPVINALHALGAILDNQSDAIVLSNMSNIVDWLDKALKSEVVGVQLALQPVLCRLLSSLPEVLGEGEEESDVASNLKSKIVHTLQENLQSSGNLHCSLLLLKTLSKHSTNSLDGLISPMMKVFNSLIKDHIGPRAGLLASTAVPVADAAASPTTAPAGESDAHCDAIITFMDLLCQRIMQLGEQRRVFLAAMAQLIEKSPNSKICSHILSLVAEQVLEKRQTFPTVKEKVSLLLKMTIYEGRGDEDLVNQYLKLIIAIYKDPAIARTELTVRLEQAFLIGTRAQAFDIRDEFMEIFNASMSRSLFTRLNYIFGVQNWESLSTHYWIHQANQLLLGSIEMDKSLIMDPDAYQLQRLSYIAENSGEEGMIDDRLEKCLAAHREFLLGTTNCKAGEILKAIGQLQHLDHTYGEALWSELLPMTWSALHKKERQEIAKAITIQLSKEYHLRQVDRRPNVIQTLLHGVAKCVPLISLPPHLVKYLGKTFNAWYIALNHLETSVAQIHVEGPLSDLKESTLDALTETYAALSEDDMFYGLWRVRSKYIETNAAISYEQNGHWDKAQQLYEQAQVKARTGTVPFSESEYTLWEDHWILCAQKLQQWDVLTDLAKQEGYSDLLLECAWRISDWTSDREPLEASIKSLMDVPTPRRSIFEAFMALQKFQAKLESLQEFQRICDEGMQLSLRKWHQLPISVCQSHIPLLQSFQQYVELGEASQIYGSLATTQAQNLEAKSHELKHILQTWRERLPNFYDDINGWSDLVAWRQLVFAMINRVYLPLVAALQPAAGSNANSSATSFAYRGYHETAWIINRFAHVARKHQLPDVCINQLTKIYTLPNIEIQEAFLKLREQAKCHYQNAAELNQGLEVISNTNLMYFGTQQKAEFFTLKGMFLAKLKLNDDANQAFANAIQIDSNLPKAWAEWGQYSDRLFQEDSSELTQAANAVSCYLQAAVLYKNGRARNILSRILWLLSLDDASGTISSPFEAWRGEIPTWYWITFIPQLLTSLSHKEAKHARLVLSMIAKQYPQSLHFQLRTTKEDYAVIKKQALAAAQNASASSNKAANSDAQAAKTSTTEEVSGAAAENDASNNPQANTPTAAQVNGQPVGQNGSTTANATSSSTQPPMGDSNGTQGPQPANVSRQPWEHVDEIMAILKTAYPLLALSMETMVDQIQQRFKCHADEDAYRLIVALLNDGVQYIGRLVSVTPETKLPPATHANITRFADSVLSKNIKVAFEQEFVQGKPNLQDYVAKLRKWRDKFEVILDRRCQTQQLEQVSSYLSEFQYQKFDEVEIPGQYLQHKDSNTDFVRIDRFMPTLDVVRGNGICYRRITMRGHDGSMHQFAIQYPAARHCRREERIVQLFRILSGVLGRRKESRRRSLTFHLPAAVPLAPHIRIVQDDSNYVSLQGIYDDYCARYGQHKDDPLRLATKKIQEKPDVLNNKAALIDLKVDILNLIQKDLVPETVVLEYFKNTYTCFSEFWRFRKQFCQQYASLTFLTYIMHVNNRFPHKLFISRKTGQVWGTEILPAMAPNNPHFQNSEAVPFRLTPNIQTLMGQISTEGVFSCSLMAIARCLTEGEFELEQSLSIFVRDELITWFTQQHRPVTQETQLPEKVATNVAHIVKRASSLSQIAPGSNLPAYQNITDLIAAAANPRNLAQMDQLWSSFL